MRKTNLILLCVVVSNLLFADDTLKMKNIGSVINTKQAVLVDKKNLHNFIANQSKDKDVDIVSIDKSSLVSGVAEKAIIKEAVDEIKKDDFFLIRTKNDFINNLNEANKQYKLNLLESLAITKYLYDNNLQNTYYPIIKALMIKEVKNYNQVDEITFGYDIENNMSANIAKKMIDEIFNNKQ
jgi:hypothetical protein